MSFLFGHESNCLSMPDIFCMTIFVVAEPVFGSTLAAICQHEQSTVPRFIQLVTEVIESKGLDTDGLYRVSGNLSAIQRIRCQVDQGNFTTYFRKTCSFQFVRSLSKSFQCRIINVDLEKYVALSSEDDVHVLTGALKLFFRELSEPIFPATLAKDFIFANRKRFIILSMFFYYPFAFYHVCSMTYFRIAQWRSKGESL